MAAYPEKLLEDYTNIDSAFRTNDALWSDKVFEISQNQIRQIIEESADSAGIFQIKAIKERFSDYKSADFTRLEAKNEQGKKINGARTYAFIYTIASSLAEYAVIIEDESVKREIFDLVSTLCEAFHMPVLANKDKLLVIFLDKDSSVFVRLTGLINRLIMDEKNTYLDSKLDKLLTTIFVCVRCIDFGIYAMPGSSWFYTEPGPRGKVLVSLTAIESCHRDFLEAKSKRESIEDQKKDEAEHDGKEKEEFNAVISKDSSVDLEMIFAEVFGRNLPKSILSLEAATDRDAIISSKKIYKELYAKIEAQDGMRNKIDAFFVHIKDREEFKKLLKNLEITESNIDAYLTTYDSYHNENASSLMWHFISGVSLSEESFCWLFAKIYDKKELTEEEKDSVNRYEWLKIIKGEAREFFGNMAGYFYKIKRIEVYINDEEETLKERVFRIGELLGLLRIFVNREMMMFKDKLASAPSFIAEIEKIERQAYLFIESLETKKEILSIGIFMENLKKRSLLETTYNECIEKLKSMYQAFVLEYDFSKDDSDKIVVFKNNVIQIVDEAILQCSGKSAKPLYALKSSFKVICMGEDSLKSFGFISGQSAFFQQGNVSDALPEQSDLSEHEIARRKASVDTFISALETRSGLRMTYNGCIEILKKEYEQFTKKYEETKALRVKKALLAKFEGEVQQIINDKISQCDTQFSRTLLLKLNEDFCQFSRSDKPIQEPPSGIVSYGK